MVKNAIIAVVGLILIAIVYASWQAYKVASFVNITTYEECAAAGYPVMESFPMQCRTPDGRTFVAPVETNEKP